MKSVGEVMAIGRTQQESLQKALRGLETGMSGFDELTTDRAQIESEIASPGPERLWYVADAFRVGMSLEEVHALSKIDPWFLAQIEDLLKDEAAIRGRALDSLTAADLRRLKRKASRIAGSARC